MPFVVTLLLLAAIGSIGGLLWLASLLLLLGLIVGAVVGAWPLIAAVTLLVCIAFAIYLAASAVPATLLICAVLALGLLLLRRRQSLSASDSP